MKVIFSFIVRVAKLTYALSMLHGRIIKLIFDTKARDIPMSAILYLANSSGCAHYLSGQINRTI